MSSSLMLRSLAESLVPARAAAVDIGVRLDSPGWLLVSLMTPARGSLQRPRAVMALIASTLWDLGVSLFDRRRRPDSPLPPRLRLPSMLRAAPSFGLSIFPLTQPEA